MLKEIRMKTANLPVLILSMHDESIYAERAMRAGANGYIMKQEATEKVLVAIRQNSAGRCLSERPADEYHVAAVCHAEPRRPRALRS